MGNIKDIRKGVEAALVMLYGEGQDKISAIKNKVNEFLASAPELIEERLQELELKFQIAVDELEETRKAFGVSDNKIKLAEWELQKAERILNQTAQSCITASYAAIARAAQDNDVAKLVNIYTLIGELEQGEYTDKRCMEQALRARDAAQSRLDHLKSPSNYQIDLKQQEVETLRLRLEATRTALENLKPSN